MSDVLVGVVGKIGDVEKVTIFDELTLKILREQIEALEGHPEPRVRLWVTNLKCVLERGHFAAEFRDALILVASEQCETCGRQVFRQHPEDFKLMGAGWLARCGRRLSAFPTDAPACQSSDDDDEEDCPASAPQPEDI